VDVRRRGARVETLSVVAWVVPEDSTTDEGRRACVRGEDFFRPNQHDSGLFLILEGRVRVCTSTPAGKRTTLKLLGSGTLTFFVGLAMISGEFRPVARLLDRAEVRARKLGRWVVFVWRSSAAGKALVASVAAICAAAALYVAYLLLFSG
jgi:hypothetical protein